MLPDTASTRLQALPEVSKQGKRINGLFRLMESPVIWQLAYASIAPNKGATTPGVGTVTQDGFSMERVTNIITLLKEDRYAFNPVRRTYIPKPNGKERPLGMPSGDDKLVQAVVKVLLEQIYEPIFSDHSHGFRPERSCQTALRQIHHSWHGVKWLVEVDIQGVFDNIDHDIMIRLFEKKIDNKRFIAIIKAMLKAGYLENWTFHRTFSGTPQGGVVSPTLANIYLHELDKFMGAEIAGVDRGKRRCANPRYSWYGSRIAALRKEVRRLRASGNNATQEIAELTRQIKAWDRERLSLPSTDPMEAGYRRLLYCRYADDTLIGVIGTLEEAKAVMGRVRRFIEETLNLRISEEKSKVGHAKKGTVDLGYEVRTVTSERRVKTKHGGKIIVPVKPMVSRLMLNIPEEKMQQFCQKKGYGNYVSFRPAHRRELLRRSNAEIIKVYNAEIRGFANYYSLVPNVRSRLRKLYFMWRVSLLRTLADKHQTTVSKMARLLRQQRGQGGTSAGKGTRESGGVFTVKGWKPPFPTRNVDHMPNGLVFALARTEVVKRLNAERCEYCGTEQGYFEVHHVRKLKNVAGKELWQQVMAAMQRKTLVLCHTCHNELHAGIRPSWKRTLRV